jgi:hypothetical protein
MQANVERTVKSFINANQQIEIAETIGTWDKLWTAIGYLSSWNLSYPTVEIWRDGKTDLVAVYRCKEGNVKYVIGAVWHDDHYGFHS